VPAVRRGGFCVVGATEDGTAAKPQESGAFMGGTVGGKNRVKKLPSEKQPLKGRKTANTNKRGNLTSAQLGVSRKREKRPS